MHDTLPVVVPKGEKNEKEKIAPLIVGLGERKETGDTGEGMGVGTLNT